MRRLVCRKTSCTIWLRVYQKFLDISWTIKTRLKIGYLCGNSGITSDFGDLIPGLAIICKNHPDMTMDIVGDGCRKKEFEGLITDQGLEIRSILREN